MQINLNNISNNNEDNQDKKAFDLLLQRGRSPDKIQFQAILSAGATSLLEVITKEQTNMVAREKPFRLNRHRAVMR